MLNKIKEYIKEKHANQFRADKITPFYTHPFKVCDIVIEYNGDINLQIAALLHDVLEDTSVTEDELRIYLSISISENMLKKNVDTIMFYVISMTNIFTPKNFPFLNRRERKKLECEYIKLWKDSSLKMLKLADIYSNLSEFDSLSNSFAKTYIEEELLFINALDSVFVNDNYYYNELFIKTKNLAKDIYLKLYGIKYEK